MTTRLVRRVRGSEPGAWGSMAGGPTVRARGPVARVRGWLARVRALGEQGMTTAEYAVGTMAAVAFAALLLAVVRSGPVKSALSQVIVAALGSGS